MMKLILQNWFVKGVIWQCSFFEPPLCFSCRAIIIIPIFQFAKCSLRSYACLMNGLSLINVFISFQAKSTGRRNKQDSVSVGEDILDVAVFSLFGFPPSTD